MMESNQAMSSAQGAGVSCERCGGHFPLQALTAAVRCPYCQHVMRLDAPAHHQARSYGDHVQRVDHHAQVERGATAQASADGAAGKAYGIFGKVVLALSLGGTLLATLSMAVFFLGGRSNGAPGYAALPRVSEETGELLGWAFRALVLAVLGGGIWYLRRRARKGQEAPAASPLAERCAHCGAPTQLLPGETVGTCQYCRGATLPSESAMAQGSAVAQLERHRAALSRYAQERRNTAAMSRHVSWQGWFQVVALVASVPMILIPVVAGLAAGGTWNIMALFVLAPMMALPAYLGWTTLRLRRAGDDAHRVTEQLGETLRAQASRDVGLLFAWLNAHWAGPYDGGRLMMKKLTVLAGEIGGYPIALAVHPRDKSVMLGGHPPFVHGLLAAMVPRLADGIAPAPLRAQAPELVARIEAAGFDVSLEDAGLLVSARPGFLEQLRRDPSRLLVLGDVIVGLARIAQHIGAQPVPGPSSTPSTAGPQPTMQAERALSA